MEGFTKYRENAIGSGENFGTAIRIDSRRTPPVIDSNGSKDIDCL